MKNVPGRPVILNCGTPTEKACDFLDHHLKPVKPYIKDSGDFIHKIKNLQSIPDDAILVTSNVVVLYPSIPHEAVSKALKDALDSRENKSIITEDLVKMTRFVLQNNCFEFNGIVKQQRLLLVLNLHQRMPAFSWISQKLISLIRKSIYR